MAEAQTQPKTTQQDLFNPQALLKRLGVTQGMTVADLGSGTGFLSIPMARQVSERGKVYSIDIMKDSLAVIHDKALSQGYRNVQTVWADLEVVGGTKITADTVDMVVMCQIYFQLENPQEALKEAARMLKKGGKLAIIDWIKGVGPIGPPDELRKSGEDVAKVTASVGLKESEHFNPDHYHYAYIFVK